jgi:hypothetical protein
VSAATSALVAGVIVVASLHGASVPTRVHVDTPPAGQPTVSVPRRGLPHTDLPTTPAAPGATTAQSSAAHPMTNQTAPPRGAAPSLALPAAPVVTPPPPNATPSGTTPRSGNGTGSVPGSPTPATDPSTSSTAPPTTTTTPASGTQVFTVKNGAGVVFGTVQVSWIGSSLTFDGASPRAGFTFVESQGDPNELDVTFTRTADGAQAHLHLEMRSQPAWHPIVD